MPEPQASRSHPSQSDPATSPATLQTVRRRRVLRWSWLAGGMAFLGSQLWILLRLFLSGETPETPRGDIVVGPVEQFGTGSVTHFWKERFLLVHAADGFLALSHDCTHGQCQVDFSPERGMIICPCHGAQFSATGAVLAGPAPRPLDRYAVTQHNGQIVVHASRRQRVPS